MRYIEDAKGGKDVDSEVKQLLDESYKRAHAMLQTHRDKLEAVAKGSQL